MPIRSNIGVIAHRATRHGANKSIALGLDDFAATIKAVGADMVTQVGFARGRFNCQRRCGQEIVRAVHAALGRGFFILLNSHFLLLENHCAKSGALNITFKNSI